MEDAPSCPNALAGVILGCLGPGATAISAPTRETQAQHAGLPLLDDRIRV